jgi:hypothetical protein
VSCVAVSMSLSCSTSCFICRVLLRIPCCEYMPELRLNSCFHAYF